MGRARGNGSPDSDIDVAMFADVATTKRDARIWSGLFLDGFVYPSSFATAMILNADLLKLVAGRVLLDERGLSSQLLARLAALDAAAPEAVTEDHRQMLRVWAKKTLRRIRRDDVEAQYRRHWLLYQLLEDYFTLRSERYRGPKLALAALQHRAPVVYSAFVEALPAGASFEALEVLVELVVAER